MADPELQRLLNGNKYRVASKRERCRDGITFDSKKEMRRYDELVLLKRAGEVLLFFTQSPVFRLAGGTKYTTDFLVLWKNGRITFEDVKGVKTEAYKIKRREVQARYGITITEL